MKKNIIGVLIVVIVLAVIYGFYQMKRSFNYSMGYKSQVTETVCDMVKPEKHAEIFVDPSVCK